MILMEMHIGQHPLQQPLLIMAQLQAAPPFLNQKLFIILLGDARRLIVIKAVQQQREILLLNDMRR